jgi:hypothetical protein
MVCTLVSSFIPLRALGDSFGGFMLSDWIATPPETKTMYTKVIMEQAVVHGVHFQQTAEFYQTELDKLANFSEAQSHAQFLQAPVAQSLATIAIINCDWNNGVEPYRFALKHLGKEKLELLKGLYSESIIRLQNNCQ